MAIILCKAVEYPDENVIELTDMTETGLQQVKYSAEQLTAEIDEMLDTIWSQQADDVEALYAQSE
ncbi:MAG: hypothetical protein IID44_10265 [Planctomycetes bacterium]|nr:hypothetical protein [Planctomycetota bacterium]